MYAFGSGTLIATPPGGTPVNVGLIESCDLSWDQTLKELAGPFNSPLEIGAGPMKVTGKAKMSRHTPLIFSSLFDGVALSTGSVLASLGEVHIVPATPFDITVTQSAAFKADLGVTYSNYAPLTAVASGPVAGQYSVNATTGMYTFSSADVGQALMISYDYTVATGSSSIVKSRLIGPTISFAIDLFGYSPSGDSYGIHFPRCVANKMAFATKNADFAQPEIDFMALADSSGNFYSRFWSQLA